MPVSATPGVVQRALLTPRLATRQWVRLPIRIQQPCRTKSLAFTDRKKVVSDPNAIYRPQTAEATLARLDEFEAG